MDQIYPKRVFLIKTRKSEHHHWNLHIWISVVTKFQLKMIILTFWTRFAHNGYFRSKIEKIEHHHWILHVLIRVCTKFQLKLIMSRLDQNCPKRLFPVENEKNEQHHWILHIRIRLATKLALKWQFWHFGANLPKKGVSDEKWKRRTPPLNSAYSN